MRIMRKAVLRDIRREWRAAVQAEGETTMLWRSSERPREVGGL